MVYTVRLPNSLSATVPISENHRADSTVKEILLIYILLLKAQSVKCN